MLLDVQVNIKLTEVVGKVGTWFPCLYTVNSEQTEDSYKEYSKLSELAVDHNEEARHTVTSRFRVRLTSSSALPR